MGNLRLRVRSSFFLVVVIFCLMRNPGEAEDKREDIGGDGDA